MAKDRRKVQHIHSSVFDKQPTPESLELGELAINNNKNGSFISTKNSDNEVVRFSEDATIVDWMEYKEVYPYFASATTPTTQDLLENKSQLLFKLNQVVADNTPYGASVNGAKDMHNNLINPISPDGTHDGAGFAVDMSMYAMSGGNPSFSSITTTCGAELNGTTEISGSLLDINVETVNANASSAQTVITSADTKITSHTYSGNTLNEKVKYVTYSGDNFTADTKYLFAVTSDDEISLSAVNKICQYSPNYVYIEGSKGTSLGLSCDGEEVTDALGLSGKTINASGGTVNITSSGSTTINGNDTAINGNNTDISGRTSVGITTPKLCLKGATQTNVYGVTTNLGIDCDNTTTASTVNLSGSTINMGGNDLSANLMNSICLKSNSAATLYGSSVTNVGINCDDTATAATTTVKGNRTIVDASVGNLGLTAKEDILESAENDIVITANNDLCATCGNDATIYGVNSTNVGVSCGGAELSPNVNVKASSSIDMTAPLVNVNGVLDVTSSGMSTNLKWSYGTPSSTASGSTNFKEDKTIVIPSSLSNLSEWSEDCLTINNDLCITGKITVTGGVFSTSDERKKEKIEYVNNDAKFKVRNIPLKSFNFKDDNTKRKVYGVIAQDVEKAGLEELVYTDEGGNKSVDYTSFLILRNAYLEMLIEHLHIKIAELEKLIKEKQ